MSILTKDSPSKKHILLADDNGLSEVLQYVLCNEGYRVTCVATGEAALATARRDPPHLVVAELDLPDLHGLTLCHRLQTHGDTGRIPIFMLTSAQNLQDQSAAVKAGVVRLFVKPFSVGEFIKRVNRELDVRPAVTSA